MKLKKKLEMIEENIHRESTEYATREMEGRSEKDEDLFDDIFDLNDQYIETVISFLSACSKDVNLKPSMRFDAFKWQYIIAKNCRPLTCNPPKLVSFGDDEYRVLLKHGSSLCPHPKDMVYYQAWKVITGALDKFEFLN